MSVERDYYSKIAVTSSGVHAVEIDKRSNYGWLFYRGSEGQWVTLRRATHDELGRAEQHVATLEFVL